MKLLRKLCFVCALIWLICRIDNSAYAGTYIPHSTFKMNTSFDVFSCAVDHKTEKYWFAILFRRRFAIPLIYPEEQTIVYCYDKASNTVSEKFTSSHRIWSIAPYEKGVVYFRDHYFFLDEEICYFDMDQKKTTVFRKPSTVGKIIALHDDVVYYRGSTAYDDRNIYLYNFMTQNIKTLCKGIVSAFADQNKLYAVTNADPIRIDIYDIDTNILLYSVTIDSSSEIISISDETILTKDGHLFTFEFDGINVSREAYDLNKNIDTGWIEDDHLIIISGDVLESYRLHLPKIDYIFSQNIGENIYGIAMQFNELFLLDVENVSVQIINVDDKEDQSTIVLYVNTK